MIDASIVDPAQNFIAGGWYVSGARSLTPKGQIVGKYERLDPNKKVVNSKDVSQTASGLNYYVRQNRVKLMAAHVFRQEKVWTLPNNFSSCSFNTSSTNSRDSGALRCWGMVAIMGSITNH